MFLGIWRKLLAVFGAMMLAHLAFGSYVARCIHCTSPGGGSRNAALYCAPSAQPLVVSKSNKPVCPQLPKRNTFLSISPEKLDIPHQPSASWTTS